MLIEIRGGLTGKRGGGRMMMVTPGGKDVDVGMGVVVMVWRMGKCEMTL